MQFLLIARDGTDAGAPGRRAAVRPDHLERARVLKLKGELLFGGAILDDNGNMIGSTMLFEMADRNALDEWLKDEPYINGAVWKSIEIVPFRLAKIE
jgi:uncharacterized protein